MNKQTLKQLIKEEIKKALKENHQPGDVVLYKGTRYIVVNDDEFIITLKNPKTQKTIKVNYNQFKNQSIDLKEIDTFRENYIMGIKSMIRNNPEKQLDKFVSSELLRMGRERLEDLTREEAQKLNTNLANYKNKDTKPSPTLKPLSNPRDMGYKLD